MAKSQPPPATAPIPAYPPPQSSSLSFTQGFLLGQLSLALILFAFIKFFIFGEPPNADIRAAQRAEVRRRRTLSHARQRSLSSSLPKPPSAISSGLNTSAGGGGQAALKRKRSAVLRNPPALTTAAMLAKTYYNVHGHQPESLDWFNVLVAQTIAQLRADALHDEAILTSLNSIMNGPSRPDFLDEIKVTEISLGEEFPIFSNCRVIPVDEGEMGGAGGSGNSAGTGDGQRLQARMDVDLSDFITLGVETKMILNWPKPFVAAIPVALSVSVVRFSGTLSLSFIPSTVPSPPNNASTATGGQHSPSPPPVSPNPTTLTFTFLDDYRLDLSVRSLLGSRSRLQDVPKIAQLVEDRLHAWFDERCVEPRFQQIVLPSLWPRMKNARGGEETSSGPGSVVSGQEQPTEGRNRRPSTAAEHLHEPPQPQQHQPRQDQEHERPHQPTPQRPTHQTPLNDLEQRLAAEGAKLRAAERSAGDRRHRPEHSSPLTRSENASRAESRSRPGMRRDDSVSGLTRRMPGGMPADGVVMG